MSIFPCSDDLLGKDRSFPMKIHQSGYTLVELSVVVALAGVVVLGSIAGATSLLRQQTIKELSAQNGDAIQRTDVYAQLPSYDGLSLRQAQCPSAHSTSSSSPTAPPTK
jgi:prepilin-type N-terminal cleavage/methylation domain-containing protein